MTLILLGAFGCTATVVAPINAGAPIELAPNQGLLLVHVDTEFPLKSLDLNNRQIARSLGKGRHIWMIRLPQGSYRWARIEIGNQPRSRSSFQLEPDDELRFEVQAGKINYPGELSIRSDSLSRWGDGSLSVRNRNHSAMVIRELNGRYDAILLAFPLHYAGLSGDGFLDYYTKKVYSNDTETSGATNPEGRVEAQTGAP